IMKGASYLYRIQSLKMQGLYIDNFYSGYQPVTFTSEI
ncbi:MAG: polyunsaturated fatty acid synthase PfaD, partial [Cyanobacteria bacterium J06573_2]